MDSVNDLSLGHFLPLSRMNELVESAHDSYINAKPYPHIVLDNFFDANLLENVIPSAEVLPTAP